MQDGILGLAYEVSRVTKEKIDSIDDVMKQTSLLAINARVKAARAGADGAAFAVVAQEIAALSNDISRLSKELRGGIEESIERLESVGSSIMVEFRGARYTDLAHNAVELIDRNLYERSCDVRWWATDSAVVDVLQNDNPETRAYASSRLGTILRSYTVYLDLWVADANGKVVATGRPEQYPRAVGLDVSTADWFRRAMGTHNGDDFAVTDIEMNAALGGAAVATYATAIRRGGQVGGRAIGALGIFFDWAPQAAAVVKGVGLSPSEWANSRVLLLDAHHRVIAASDDTEILSEQIQFHPNATNRGYFVEVGKDGGKRLVAYALTPGYETYTGLGWYGLVESREDAAA